MIDGNQLKKARINANLSQIEVSKKLGISRQSISKWENGKNFPDIDNLTRICDLYSISLDYIFEFESSENDQNKMKDDSVLLLILTGIIALIPIGQIFLPFYVLWKNKKINRLSNVIIITNILVILLGIYTAYNIVSTILPMSVD